MTDYTELVKALRETAKHLDGISRFPYDDDPAKRIYSKKMADAAAAIEALQAEVKRLEPKRGEWIETEEMEWGIYPFKKKTCSVCDCKIDHIFMLACMDYFDDRDTVFHYCPNCGARMEVQE